MKQTAIDPTKIVVGSRIVNGCRLTVYQRDSYSRIAKTLGSAMVPLATIQEDGSVEFEKDPHGFITAGTWRAVDKLLGEWSHGQLQ